MVIPRAAIAMILGMVLAGSGAAAGTAWAQAAPGPDAAPDGDSAAPDAPGDGPDSGPDSGPAPSAVRVTSLDGTYLALGPMAAFVRADGLDGKWDGGFGGEISLVRVRERELLASLGIVVGALRLAVEERGRLWAEVLAGTRLAGIHAGLGIGGGVEIDAEDGLGTGHATVWIFAGVIPYARVGMVEGDGPFAEIGIRVALPVVDF
jgi:hypothetical protein